MKKRTREGEFWADKLMDLANFSATVLIFGQFVESKFSWKTLTIGAIIYLGLLLVALKFLNENI